MVKKNFSYNKERSNIVALNGFEVVEYVPFKSYQGQHHTTDNKGKKYIVFNYRDDKERFQWEHSSSIVKTLTKKRALKLLAADGVDIEELNRLGEHPGFWDEYVMQHGTRRYFLSEDG